MKNQSTSPKRTRIGIVASVALLFVASLAPQTAYGDPVKLADIANDKLYPTEQHTYNLKAYFQDPQTDSVALTFSTGTATNTTVNINLFPDTAPKTVSNFLRYVETGAYNNTFFHRSVRDFVVQGGGFTYTTNTDGTKNFFYAPSFGKVINEFSRSNLRGTLAMAKVGNDPNSATNQWFVNIEDNDEILDAQNGGFTVFGELASSTDIDFFDYVNNLPTQNAFDPGAGDTSALTDDSGNVFFKVPHNSNAYITLVSATTNSTLSLALTANSAPGVVIASIDANGLLTIVGGTPAVDTTATLTVTATTGDGLTLAQTFNVTVTAKRHFDADNTFPNYVIPGKTAQGSLDFSTYNAYPAGTAFSIADGEVSFDGKKWLKKGVVPAGASTIYVRVKTKNAYNKAFTATLTIGGEPIRFTAYTGTPDLFIAGGDFLYKKTPISALAAKGVYLGEGDKFDIQLVIANRGSAPSPATTISVWFDYTADSIEGILATKATKSVSIPKIAAGASRTITLKGVPVKSAAPEYSAANSYTAYMCLAIDPKGKLPEVGADALDNNYAFPSLAIGRPNLAFTAASFSGRTPDAAGKYALGVGEKHNIEFSIGNSGKFVAKATKASLWLVNNSTGLATSVKPLKTLSIPKVAAGVQTAKPLVFKNLVIKQAGDFSYKIEIDREEKLVGESKSDNTVTLRANVTAAP